MATFIVHVREVHVQKVEVEADTRTEAIKKVQDGQGNYLDNELEYSHCLDPDTWTVTES